MRKSSQLFVGEIKVKSPFSNLDRPKSFYKLKLLCLHFADIISVHTDERWGGCLKDVRDVAANTAKPILAKGIHNTDEEVKEALNHNATYVLVVGRLPKDKALWPYCWVEPLDLKQLSEFTEEFNGVLVWNSRDLSDGGLKQETFDEAFSLVKQNQLIQASNIKSPEDVNSNADGFIVGTYLEQFIKERIYEKNSFESLEVKVLATPPRHRP